MPSLLDLCSGAGGSSLGFRRAGYEVSGVDVDPASVVTYMHNVGPCVTANLRTWSPSGSRDVVGGGVPCQSFSEGGARGGLGDIRGTVVADALRIADEARAKVFWLENSTGIERRTHRGKPVSVVLEEVCRAMGWHVTTSSLNAERFGVPQSRVRWFLVGFRSSAALERFRWPEGTSRVVSVRQALGLRGAYDSGGRILARSGSKIKKTGTHYSGHRILDVERPSPTVTTKNTEFLKRCGGQPVRIELEQLAVLQGFPKSFHWCGGTSQKHRQIGNALPPALGEALGLAIALALYGGG